MNVFMIYLYLSYFELKKRYICKKIDNFHDSQGVIVELGEKVTKK